MINRPLPTLREIQSDPALNIAYGSNVPQKINDALKQFYANKDLIAAVENNDVTAIVQAYVDGAKIKSPTSQERSLLLLAVEKKFEEAINRLAKLYRDQISDLEKSDAIKIAIMNRDLKILNCLIEQFGLPKKIGITTPLLLADNDIDTIKYLLEKNADVNDGDVVNQTPLQAAVKKEDVEAIETLLAAGADCNIRGKDGETPLITLMNSSHNVNEKIFNLLVDKTDLDIQDDAGWTALHICVFGNEEEGLQFAIQLLEKGANPLIKNDDNKIPSELLCIPAYKQMFARYESAYGKVDNQDSLFTKLEEIDMNAALRIEALESLVQSQGKLLMQLSEDNHMLRTHMESLEQNLQSYLLKQSSEFENTLDTHANKSDASKTHVKQKHHFWHSKKDEAKKVEKTKHHFWQRDKKDKARREVDLNSTSSHVFKKLS